MENDCQIYLAIKGNPYLSSSPPNFLAIFLSEKIVPNISFASSSALRVLDCCSGGGIGLTEELVGRRAHFFLYMQSAKVESVS